MAKTSPAPSRPGKEVNISAESIWSKPLTKRQKATLDRIATKQQSLEDGKIDYSDIPELTDEQLAEFRRRAVIGRS